MGIEQSISSVAKRVSQIGRDEQLMLVDGDQTGRNSTIDIAPYSGQTIKKDTPLLITSGYGTVYPIELNADLVPGARLISLKTELDLGTSILPGQSYITIKKTDILTLAAKNYENVHLHLYRTGGNNTNDYLPNFSQFNFNVNTAVTLADGDSKPNRWGAQFGIFTAIEECTIDVIKGYASTDGATGDDATISLWAKPVTENGTANTDIRLLKSFTLTSQNNQNYVFNLENTTAITLNQNEVIIPTIRRHGEHVTSTSKWYADIEILISYNRS